MASSRQVVGQPRTPQRLVILLLDQLGQSRLELVGTREGVEGDDAILQFRIFEVMLLKPLVENLVEREDCLPQRNIHASASSTAGSDGWDSMPLPSALTVSSGPPSRPSPAWAAHRHPDPGPFLPIQREGLPPSAYGQRPGCRCPPPTTSRPPFPTKSPVGMGSGPEKRAQRARSMITRPRMRSAPAVVCRS